MSENPCPFPPSGEEKKNLLGNSLWPSALIDTHATRETISQEHKHMETQTVNTQRISYCQHLVNPMPCKGEEKTNQL